MRFESCVVMSLLAVFIRQDFVFLRSVIFLGSLRRRFSSFQSRRSLAIMAVMAIFSNPCLSVVFGFFRSAAKGFGFRSSPCLRHLRNLRRTDLKFSISAILAILAVLAIFSHLPYRLLLPITRFPDLPILLRAKFFLIALYFHARFCLYCFEAGFILNRK
jgi:hypothetical protein